MLEGMELFLRRKWWMSACDPSLKVCEKCSEWTLMSKAYTKVGEEKTQIGGTFAWRERRWIGEEKRDRRKWWEQKRNFCGWWCLDLGARRVLFCWSEKKTRGKRIDNNLWTLISKLKFADDKWQAVDRGLWFAAFCRVGAHLTGTGQGCQFRLQFTLRPTRNNTVNTSDRVLLVYYYFSYFAIGLCRNT